MTNMTIILAPHCFYTTGGQNAQQLARKPKKEKGQRGTNNAFDTANILIVLCLSKKTGANTGSKSIAEVPVRGESK